MPLPLWSLAGLVVVASALGENRARAARALRAASSRFDPRGSSPTMETTPREGRKLCWDSRDGYFACLDAVGVLDAGKEGDACTAEKNKYQENCAKSWVRLRVPPVVVHPFNFLVILKGRVFQQASHSAGAAEGAPSAG